MRKEDPSHVDSGWDDDDEFDPQSLIGEIIDENTPSALRLNRLLGAGSYAFVYSAVPVSSSSNASSLPVAVKCLFKQGLASDQLELQRTEADILRRLGGHPNIVKLISVSESSTFLFLVLDRCDEDLLEVIMSGKVCATGSFYDISDEMDMVETVKDLFSQLLDAVEFCHANGIYHRDIKPENVLAVFSSTGEISLKLTDFGLASFNRHPMDYGVGSVSYTSPESLAGPKPLNNWAQVGHDAIANDTWSLGIVLFNLLTSKNPWYSATAEDSAYADFVKWHAAAKVNYVSPQATVLKPSPLRELFGLSEGCDHLFFRVFDPNPDSRCTIQELRTLVSGVHRFVGPKMSNAAKWRSSIVGTQNSAALKSSSNVGALEHSRKKPSAQNLQLLLVPSTGSRARRQHSWSSDTSEMDYSVVVPAMQRSLSEERKGRSVTIAVSESNDKRRRRRVSKTRKRNGKSRVGFSDDDGISDGDVVVFTADEDAPTVPQVPWRFLRRQPTGPSPPSSDWREHRGTPSNGAAVSRFGQRSRKDQDDYRHFNQSSHNPPKDVSYASFSSYKARRHNQNQHQSTLDHDAERTPRPRDRARNASRHRPAVDNKSRNPSRAAPQRGNSASQGSALTPSTWLGNRKKSGATPHTPQRPIAQTDEPQSRPGTSPPTSSFLASPAPSFLAARARSRARTAAPNQMGRSNSPAPPSMAARSMSIGVGSPFAQRMQQLRQQQQQQLQHQQQGRDAPSCRPDGGLSPPDLRSMPRAITTAPAFMASFLPPSTNRVIAAVEAI